MCMVSICSLFHCLRGIFDLLPPLCWDLRRLGSIEPCLCRLGHICASFCARPNFWVHRPSLACLLFHGLLMQAWVYSIVESTFGLLILVASATVLCIRTYRWSRGHIPIKVLSNVEYSVGCLPDRLCEIWLVQTYICVHTTFRWTHLAKSSNLVMVFIDCAPKTIDYKRNRPIILSDHHS